MTTTNLQASTSDERVMAGLSHISAMLPFMGVLAPILIWITQKDKSRYVAFQALQAMAYQLLMIGAWFVGMGCYMLSFFGTFLTIPFAPSEEAAEAASPLFMLSFMIPFLVFGAIFLGGFFFILYGIIGAVNAFQGRDFRYWLIGRWVERFMNPTAGA